MIPRLSPAYLRAAARLMGLYPEAAAHLLAEEQATEVVSPPSADERPAPTTPADEEAVA